jgi:hypothetical protein
MYILIVAYLASSFSLIPPMAEERREGGGSEF